MAEYVHSVSALRPWLDERGVERVLLISGKSRRFVAEVEHHLGGLETRVFAGAVVHVPSSVVAVARSLVQSFDPEAIVSIGGGAATGLAKVLRLFANIPFVAIPTTYSGSETTTIWGTSSGGEKQTGRDPRVRPDLVIYEPDFVPESQPFTVASLINTLAHPISAAAAGSSQVDRALFGVTDALLRILAAPDSPRSRRAAIDAVIAAGEVLDNGKPGFHHKIAHKLGGRFGAQHRGLHSVLLAHSTFALEPEVSDAIHRAAAVADLPALIGDALAQVKAPASLAAIDIDGAELRQMIDAGELPEWVWDAFLGLRPSRRYRRLEPRLWAAGAPLDRAERVVIAVHGRGSDATAAIRQVRAVIADDPAIAILAPQAETGAWYEAPYADATTGDLAGPIGQVNAAIDRAVAAVGAGRVFVHGFSQGTCLALAAIAERGEVLGGLVALSGARPPNTGAPSGLDDMPVLIAAAEKDKWLVDGAVSASASELRDAGAAVTELRVPDPEHQVRGRERVAARELITGWSRDAGPRGFGNSHEVECLPGALPRDQNNPREVPYGLWAEQLSGTGFVAERGRNLRSWLYRIRPATQHGAMTRRRETNFIGTFANRRIDPNLFGWRPLALPERPTDLVDGITTLGGAGSAELRRGYAVHLYAANASMENKALTNSDGDLLVVPQLGTLTLLTELGVLEVGPGSIAVIPRGFKFSALVDGPVRGWIGEVFGRHFELPDRGPVGANGLTDERHFVAPSPHFEDRHAPSYRIITKLGGNLWEATQDYSPYDVVAWHGNYAPYRYDLSSFSPVGNTRFDHVDPSIYVVIGAPLDERGASCLDFVFFPPRWDPTERTLRPPWFHRNAIAEINGIIADPGLRAGGPFSEGCTFVTPTMTAHGVLSRNLEAARRGSDRPHRISDESAWFQFESALPFALTNWADGERIDHWRAEWGAHRTHYDPGQDS